MKREAPEEHRNAKRQKLDPKPVEVDKVFGERRFFKYLLGKTKIEKPPGYIVGVVKTIIDTGPIVQLELVPFGEDPADRQDILEVLLSKLHLETLDPLRVGDKLLLFLKGGRIAQLGSKKRGLAVKLMFTEGFHIKFGKKDIAEINAFIGPKPKAVEVAPKAPPEAEPQAPIAPLKPNPIARVSKNQRKKRQSAEHEKKTVVKTPVHRESPVLPVKQESAKPDDREILRETGPSHSKAPAPNQPLEQVSVKQDAPQSNPTPILQPPGEYTALDCVETKKSGIVSLIGVVLQVDAATQSRFGSRDWLRSIRIIDCTKVDSSSWRRGIKCNLFAPAEHLLPDPELGDIIILKKVAVQDCRGTIMPVGQCNRFSWAIFSKDKREVYYGAKTSPQDHRSSVVCPFYVPLPSDIAYCEKLLDLYLEVERKEQEEAERTRVVPVDYTTRRRCHRLVEELKPPGPELTNEYFNCTVEVLRGFSNENGVFTLWVTDYTKHPLAFPPQSDWCPPQLAPYVFRIEMWDAAANEGVKMKEQTIYLLNNVRIRVNTAGYLEGKSVEAKQVLLDEKTDDSVHLKSLLERRKAWQKETGYVPEKVEDKLLQNASLDKLFHCTVEVLHAEHHEGKASMVYCTDYSSRDDFAAIPSKAMWAKGLENRVVKFVLSEGQSLIAKFLKQGDFCRFNKMRLRLDRDSGRVIGLVGGNQDLMEKLNPKNKENGALHDLYRRKETLFKPPLPHNTFQEILDLKVFPEKFRVQGHVVSYEPRNLDEAIFLWCKTCKRQLKTMEKMCHECETDEGLEPRSNLFLTVEDKDVNRVLVSVSEKAFIFQDLDLPAYLDDPDVRRKLGQRLQPFLGPLADKPLPAPAKGPPLVLEVVAWLDSAGDVAFTLVNASVA